MSEIHPLQAMLDGMSAKWQRDRAATQMTLGALMNRLKELPPDLLIDGLARPHSYRGYYSDLAFEPSGNRRTTAETLAMCQECMGQVFQGYKGGDFMMGATTPVWIAEYGCSGAYRIMEIKDDGSIVAAKEED
jgi:hypothetical protein